MPESYFYRFLSVHASQAYKGVLNTRVFTMFNLAMCLFKFVLFHLLLNLAMTLFVFAILLLFLLVESLPHANRLLKYTSSFTYSSLRSPIYNISFSLFFPSEHHCLGFSYVDLQSCRISGII